ncbi:hypothetical protein HMPREF1624_03299 [Sporothrix schenckii ATCC 58251]|uniref:SGNH hydrolase-type esterase domain-containing protein n=1 Tax=Sporothrix schenckii (strain ATCC 58251 / de Perez 2211183) TaxID=1391915 RepID=U7PZP6_SPOS1|nr:hypothetical protein HMPREF1624_03299 [Sporothrix schenckii ATCC 58251]
MHLPSLISASSWLVVLSGTEPARAAVLPATITNAWRIPRVASWFGGSDARQKALGSHAPEHRDTGLRWTSKGFASLGDSYSAGIGTHLDGGKEASCRLGFGAYPALLHVDLGLDADASAGSNGNKGGKGDNGGDANITAFQWLSCTGATTADVLGSPSSTASNPGQINTLLTDPAVVALDYITLSIGGNDLGFFDVINACVFRFYGYYSGTCEAALRASELLLAEDDRSTDPASFSARLTVILLQLLARVRWEKHPQFRIIVTGYARFFNAETDLCDRASMSIWWHYGNATGVPDNATDTTYLTKGLRRRMNGLVAGANRKLKAIVDSVNARYGNTPHVLFVDYDDAFEGHRFCEPGVVEPDYKRDATWFFLVGGTDNGADVPDDGPDKGKGGKNGENGKKGKKGTKEALPLSAPTVDPDSYLVDPLRCRGPADARGDWGERALCDMVQAQAANPALLPVVGSFDAGDADASVYGDGRLVSPENSMWYVPTYYGKTFHPRSNGHMAVRDAIYRTWEENGI